MSDLPPATAPRYRALAFGITRGVLVEGPPGIHYLRAAAELQPPAQRMTDRLGHWASVAPGRTFIARRARQADGSTGDWPRRPAMKIEGQAALVTGGASGLGQATARELARLGARVAVLDRNAELAADVASDLCTQFGDGAAVACTCDITDTASVTAALEKAALAHGPARILLNVAGIGSARRIVGKDGGPAPLEDFVRVVNVNLIGSYNVSRLFAAQCAKLDALASGEKGVLMFTASVAAFDGQVGQQAYSASKAGLVGMTLPMARDLAQHSIRVCTIAPGLFATPLLMELPEPIQQTLAASIPFPKRLGKPSEFAELACHIVVNGHLNGEVIRLDGALRMAPR